MKQKLAVFCEFKSSYCKSPFKHGQLLPNWTILSMLKITYKDSLIAFLSSSSLIFPNLLLVALPCALMMVV